jgi:hypothetical protein
MHPSGEVEIIPRHIGVALQLTPHTQQADSVMVVGMGEDPGIGEYERLLISMKTTARKELVLLHPYRNVTPGSTRTWLKVAPPYLLTRQPHLQ